MPALYNACVMVAAWSMPGPAPCASVPARVPVAYEMQTRGNQSFQGRSISDCSTRWTSFDCLVVMPGASAARRDTAIGSIRTLPVGLTSTESFAMSPEGGDTCANGRNRTYSVFSAAGRWQKKWHALMREVWAR